MPKRKVSPESRTHAVKRRRERELGTLFAEGNPWTNEETSRLLDGILVDHWSPRTFHVHLGRSEDSIKSRLWKVCANYREGSEYTSVDRINRTGRPFDKWDLGLLEKCLGDQGLANKAYIPHHIGKVLGRATAEVEIWLEARCAKTPVFDRVAPLGEGWDDMWLRIGRVVGKTLSGAFQMIFS